MKVLFVDDMRGRLEVFLALLDTADVDAEVVHRQHPGEVTDTDLATADVVLLDHDMCVAGARLDIPCPNPGKWGGCGCPDGRALVRRILARQPVEGQRYIVHSANPVGRRAMVAQLARAEREVASCPVEQWHWHVPSALLRTMGVLR